MRCTMGIARRAWSPARIEDFGSVCFLVGDYVVRHSAPTNLTEIVVTVPEDDYAWFTARPVDFRNSYTQALLARIVDRNGGSLQTAAVRFESGSRWRVNYCVQQDQPCEIPNEARVPVQLNDMQGGDDLFDNDEASSRITENEVTTNKAGYDAIGGSRRSPLRRWRE